MKDKKLTDLTINDVSWFVFWVFIGLVAFIGIAMLIGWLIRL